MPPFRIAVRNQDRAHPNYAWFAYAKTYDTPEEAADGMEMARGLYPEAEGYVHRIEDLTTKDEAGTWKEMK